MPGFFSWNDGVQEPYYTPDWTPRVEPVRDMPGQVIPLLSGGRMITQQLAPDNTILIREGVKLTWEQADPDLLAIVESTYVAGRQVTVFYPWRGDTASLIGHIPPNGKKEDPIDFGLTRLEVTILEM